MVDFIAHPDDPFRVGDFLVQGFADEKWAEFRAAIAFVKRSGTKHIHDPLQAFNSRASTSVRISIGVDKGGTSLEGATDLLDAVGSKGHVWVFKNSNALYHPKIYLFKNDSAADVIVGSVNLTQGGLYENYEGSVRVELDLTNDNDKKFLESIEAALDYWITPTTDNICLPLTEPLLTVLATCGDLPTEIESRDAEEATRTAKKAKHPGQSPFGSVKTQPAPIVPKGKKDQSKSSAAIGTTATGSASPTGAVVATTTELVPLTFGMTLQKTDVGKGQTTKGKEPRSPEVFIPLLALDLKPDFWGWLTPFSPDPSKYVADSGWATDPEHAKWIAGELAKPNRKPRPLDKLDWENVTLQLAGHSGMVDSSFWFNPIKKDIRIRAEPLRSAGKIDDILLVRQGSKSSGYEYSIEVVPTTDPRYPIFLARLTHKIKHPSLKKIGYF